MLPETHLHRQRMSGVPKADAAEAPPSRDFTERAGIIQVRFTGAEREFVNRVGGEVVADVKDARPVVAAQAVDIFRSIRLTPANRPIVNGMGPCVPGLEG
jgi:hypothetical protein